ncbi:Uncharacterised protein [Moraxella cuniculi]|uniref:Uncharacterized protein n=2 Tax=Moraxella cuniculi TaxID=34061 RepID=A0A448GTG6_9GAMM|nr:Uncharacterised protein [Moraxella cuniculi]
MAMAIMRWLCGQKLPIIGLKTNNRVVNLTNYYKDLMIFVFII